MKKISAAIACSIALTAYAASPYDGIYQNKSDPNTYISVQTNGSIIIATMYNFQAVKGITLSSIAGGVMPSQLNTWDLMSGTLTDNIARMNGQMAYGACNMASFITFFPTFLYYSVGVTTNTALGNLTANYCSLVPSLVQQPATYNKVF